MPVFPQTLRNTMSNSPALSADALLLCRDLFFTSKVSGTASALGYRVETEETRERALAKAAAGNYRCLLLDLGWTDFPVAELIAALPAAAPPVIAFGAHVETARLEEARAAGCTEVLPRSKFSATLPDLLTRYLRP